MNELEIYTEAISRRDTADRESYLDRACDGDPELRMRIDQLLKHARRVGDFLQEPAVVLTATAAKSTSVSVGAQIGPYVLREQIGDGGMGVVYVAEQSEPVRRKVAVKIIKPGMASKSVIARFEAERQALAMMDHPNIARVFDGGATNSGQPFFVMELVQGLPINEFCDNHNLPLRPRLHLFLDVCRAVEHAHQKGVIHRDLKPSNVLVAEVDGRPMPKIIDFGVAKAFGEQLVEKTLYTNFAQMIGTPTYMSPEQASMGVIDVDTRSDVYSLGVLLYELLAGAPPFDQDTLKRAGFDEMRRIIREDEPIRPSARVTTLKAEAISTVIQRRSKDLRQIRNSLRGEIDWIVMKSLEKDRTRRYPSASDLAQDVERHLRNEPVTARPTSALYRIKKFAMRHRIGMAAFTAVCLAILLGLGISTRGYMSARQKNAENEILWKFVSEMYGESDRSLVTTYSPNRSMREALDVAAKVLPDRFGGHDQLEIRARRLLANMYRAIQQLPPAKQQLLAALETAEAEYGQHSVEVAHILSELAALIQPLQGRRVDDLYRHLIEAQGYGKRALSIYRKHEIQSETMADTLYSLAVCVRDDPHGQLEAEEYLREILSITDSPLAMADVAEHLAHQHELEKQDEAIKLSTIAVEKGRQQFDNQDTNLATLLYLQGKCLRLRGLPSDSAEALRCYQEAKEIFRRPDFEAEPFGYRIALELAETHLAAHRHAAAHRVLDEVEERCRDYQLTDTLVRCRFVRGWGHLLRDDFEAAEESLRRAYREGLENNLDPKLVIMAYVRFYHARALYSLGRHEEAASKFREHYERGTAAADAVYPDDMGLYALAWSALHTGVRTLLPEAQKAIERGFDAAQVPCRRRSLPQFYLVRAIAERQSGNLGQAIESLKLGLAEYDEFSMSRLYLHRRDTPKTRRDLEVTLAQYLMEQDVKNLQEAKNVHLEGISKRQRELGHNHLRVALAALRYGTFLKQQKQFLNAKEQLERAHQQLDKHSEAALANRQLAAQQLVEVCDVLQLPEDKDKWQKIVDRYRATSTSRWH